MSAHETPKSTLLTIMVTRDSRGTVGIRVTGELDLSTIGDVNSALDRATPAERVTLDLAGVTFADVTGIGCVLDWRRRSRREGWRLEIDRRLSRQVRTLVELIGLETALWGD